MRGFVALLVVRLCLDLLGTSSAASVFQPHITPQEIQLALQAVSRSETCPVIYEGDPPARSSNGTSPRIINGDLASEKVAPSLVAWFKRDYTGGLAFSCTGTLVSRRWVITAAHCRVGEYSEEDVAYVLMRNSYLTHPDNRNAVDIEVLKAFSHEEYLSDDTPSSQQHDIAAIQLAADAPEEAVPMKLNVNMDIPEANSFIRVIGFGNNEGGSDTFSRPLAQVDVPVTPTDKCAKIHQGVSNVEIQHDTHVCVGYVGRGGCGSCQGDSGGPLIQYDANGDPVLVAVVSAGVGCARADFPSVNMRVANFREWLDAKGVDYMASDSTSPIFQTSTGLSTGAIAGIIIGVLMLSIVVIFAVVFVVRRRRREVAEDIEATPPVAPIGAAVGVRLPPPAYPYDGVPPLPPGGSQQRPPLPLPSPVQGGTTGAVPVQVQYVPLVQQGTPQQPQWNVGATPGPTAPALRTSGLATATQGIPPVQYAPLYPPPTSGQGGQDRRMAAYSLPPSAGQQSQNPPVIPGMTSAATATSHLQGHTSSAPVVPPAAEVAEINSSEQGAGGTGRGPAATR